MIQLFRLPKRPKWSVPAAYACGWVRMALIILSRPTILTLDSFPFREDPVKAVDLSMRNVKAMINMVNTLDIKALKEAQKTMDAVATQEIARKMVFRD